MLGYHLVDCQLKLEDTWAANRHRWWVVASKRPLRIPEIPDMPFRSLSIRDLIPYFREWPEHELEQLILRDKELAIFLKHSDGNLRKHCVRVDGKLPTALHSWGQQAVPCACGCREFGFSDELLSDKCLYAQVVSFTDPVTKTQLYRHLHAIEVAILNGVPPLIKWSSNQRLNLCAVGQIASPLQAVWVGSHAIRQLQCLFGLQPIVEPETCLNDLKRLVLQQAQSLFPSLPEKPVSAIVHVQRHGSDTCVPLTVHPSATAEQFLQAECTLAHQNPADWVIIDNSTDLPVHPLSVLAGQSIRVLPVDVVVGGSKTTCPLFDEDVPMDDLRPPSNPPVVDFVDKGLEPAKARENQPPIQNVLPKEMIPDGQHTGKWNPSALLTLSAKQLSTLIPPQVDDHALCQAMRDQQMNRHDRLTILTNQSDVWGDDEVAWHLARLVHSSKVPHTICVDPLLAQSCAHSLDLSALTAWIENQSPFTCLVTCVSKAGHWTPIVWRTGKQLVVQSWDHTSVDPSWLRPFHGLLCKALRFEHFQEARELRSFAATHLCGAASIAYIDFCLTGNPLPHKESHLAEYHRDCRQQFRATLEISAAASRPWCWGSGTDIIEPFAAILVTHGVPESVSVSRAKLLVQSLGKEAVEKAVRGGSPWKTIKSLANQHSPPVQLVLPDEQQAARKPTGNSTGKSKSRKQAPLNRPKAIKPADLDPSKLVLEPGTFRSGSDEPVPQLQLTQVGPLSTGVALTNFAAAQTFLKAGTLLTNKGLALLILNATEEPQTTLSWSTVRFAAKCALNHEPMLLTGFLVQLGKEPVYLFRDVNCQTLPDVSVACARITVYRDQWDGSWETFQNKPVKACLGLLPPLQTCRSIDCECSCWHPSFEEPLQDVILDVFRRQYFTEAGRPVEWTSSTYFAFTVRHVKCQEVSLLMCSGRAGVYIEPKTEDASSPHLDFPVVWLPHLGYAEIVHKAQCEPHSLGVARSGKRYGVRVRSIHFQQVFQALKPDGFFLAPGSRVSWHCGPWPYGVDRKTLAAVFKKWGWQARPLQPTTSVQGGMMWTVQSVVEPPQVVFTMQHGQVVISRAKQAIDSSTAPAEVIGQSQTVQLCTNKAGDDPWTLQDPGQNAIPTNAIVPSRGPDNTQIIELEARLEQSILSKLPQQMEDDGQEQRVQMLETQVAQLINRQQSFEVTVQENQSSTHAQVQQLQAQMTAQMDLQGRKMQSMLDDLSKLEAILSKRSRHEWWLGSSRCAEPHAFRVCHFFARFTRSIHRIWHGFWSLFVLLTFLGGCRVGEASVPGPSNNDPHWTLGVCNPSGLVGKSHILSSVPADVLAISETHLTTSARRSFVGSLRSTNQGFTHFTSGCPLPPRSQVSDAGDWAGVAVASKFPCRSLSADWPPDLFESGRIQFCTAYVQSFWLCGANIYGYPAGVTHPQAWERTMAMLDFAVARVLHGCVGPRFLAGDWNFEPNQVNCWQTLLDEGWVEVQDLVETKFGTKPRNTCKSRTRKDFLWISPELACHFRALHFHEVFADHVVMCADFSHHSDFGDRWLWPRPSPIDWTSVPDLPFAVDFSDGEPSDLYCVLWEQREYLAQQTSWKKPGHPRWQVEHPLDSQSFEKGGMHLLRRAAPMTFNLPSMEFPFNIADGSNNFVDLNLMLDGLLPPRLSRMGNMEPRSGGASFPGLVSNLRLLHGGTPGLIVAQEMLCPSPSFHQPKTLLVVSLKPCMLRLGLLNTNWTTLAKRLPSIAGRSTQTSFIRTSINQQPYRWNTCRRPTLVRCKHWFGLFSNWTATTLLVWPGFAHHHRRWIL